MLQLILFFSLIISTASEVSISGIFHNEITKDLFENFRKWIFTPDEINRYLKNLNKKINRIKICHTAECEKTAQLILDGMNKSMDPCIDFYEYACGFWTLNHPVEIGEKSLSVDTIIEDDIYEKIRDILESDFRIEDNELLKTEKKWFNACMDIDTIEKNGIEPLIRKINKIGGWPLATNYLEKNALNFTWQDVDNYYSKLGNKHAMFSIRVSNDLQNPDVNVLHLTTPNTAYDLLWKREMNTDMKFNELTSYEKFIGLIASKFAKAQGFIEIDKSQLIHDIKKMMAFEDALMEIINAASANEAKRRHMTIRELQTLYDFKKRYYSKSKIHWLQVFQNLLREVNIKIDDSEVIIVYDPDFIQELHNLLRRMDEKVIVNYIHWHFIINMLPYVNKEIQDQRFELMNEAINDELESSNYEPSFPYEIKNYNSEEKDRWKTCIIQMPLKHGISKQFVSKYMSYKSLKYAEEMFNKIKNKMKNQILNTEWMNNNTVNLTIQKLDHISADIGQPFWYSNSTMVKNYYKNLEIGPSYIENVINFNKFAMKKSFSELINPHDKRKWYIDPLTPNAYYSMESNVLTIPAAELLKPHFGLSLPVAAQYGVVGFIIGHEIAHAFDVTGRAYNQYGVFDEWWTQEAVDSYDEKAECFIKQFNNFEENGKLTESENIADSTGLRANFEAYTLEANEDLRLPGLEEFDGNQLFFLSFANSMCSSTARHFSNEKMTDLHSQNKWRVIGSLRNLKAFSEAFQCHTKSSMNPEDRCILWE